MIHWDLTYCFDIDLVVVSITFLFGTPRKIIPFDNLTDIFVK